MPEEHQTCAIHYEFEKRFLDLFESFGRSLGQTENNIVGAAMDIKEAVKALAADRAEIENLKNSDTAQWDDIKDLRKKVYIGVGIALCGSPVIAALTAGLVAWWLQ